MGLVELLLLNAAFVAAAAVSLWLASLALRDASIVDIFWGPGFAAIGWLTLTFAAASSLRAWLLAALATAWGLRLAAYLAWRNWGQPEDRRYRAMREAHGGRFWWASLWIVFALQGVVMWIVSLPIQAAGTSLVDLGWLDLAGVAVWLTGWVIESLGDFQLARFKADPANRGQIMDRGLWRYTRHPNYFGDFLVWWGIYIVALAGDVWWTIVSPLLMSLLLLRVSGVALLERDLEQRKPGYRDYARHTSPFVPWPRGKSKL